MRRQFLATSALLVATFSGLPTDKLYFRPKKKTTFFHINSHLSFWKNEAARKNLLNIISQDSLLVMEFTAPALSITINQDNLEHVAIYHKVSQRLQAAKIDFNVVFLSDEIFWDNWTSYEFTLIDWMTGNLTPSDLAAQMISANSHFCMDNAPKLASASLEQKSIDPFCFLAAAV
ncbi:hypothetical protein K2X05_07365 [bacterium]|nr:hypothetical protein [bacterium]